MAGVELGRFGWLDRLHLTRPLAHSRTRRPLRIVDWADVDRLERGRLVLRSGAKVREQDRVNEVEPQPARTAAGG